jgi:hypothetical protein
MTDTEPTTVLETETEQGTDVAPPRPRPRWGTAVWGLLVVLAAFETLSIAGSPDARADFVQWWVGLGVGGLIVVGVLALGALILLQGVLALLKRATRAR